MTPFRFDAHALEIAPTLLGAVLGVESEDGTVLLRITEVEAYHGIGTPGPHDESSHASRRKTKRNASMFGPPGHAYVYFTYGMHHALNVVCSPEGTPLGSADSFRRDHRRCRARPRSTPGKTTRDPANRGRAAGKWTG